ncbi:MAG: hypothetical protein U0744_15140 [Gemmataceae bacterium]
MKSLVFFGREDQLGVGLLPAVIVLRELLAGGIFKRRNVSKSLLIMSIT